MSAQQQAYLKQIKKYKLFITLSRIFLFVIFLFLWEISARFGLIEAFIFSSPSRICICFYKMLIDKCVEEHIFLEYKHKGERDEKRNTL